ncbi:oxidoreductase [Chrysochromulina tobinii]|uniref:Oxidoreductase n=1 Tax=Chrysochromulina tobinii TaxID=1460289 RepID=A0A0M0K3L5_9EUKA|nr:oxidoreductase [Chrysochromulina tobinii]|eukprot:KOO33420.1 oxidoreductase [Chrysochromulina sp. CCMP291]
MTILRLLARQTRLPGATDNTRYGEGRASPRSFLTHHVVNISTAIQTADAQTILNAASARMLRVSYGVIIASSSGSSISVDDLATTVRVLKALASADGGPTAEYREPRFKPLREAIQLYVDDVRARLFHGQGADKYTRRKENKRRLDAKAQQERAMDRAAAEKTQMRAERLRMLADLERQGGAAALMLVPDGAVADGDGVAFRASLAALTHEAHDSSGAYAAAADEAGAGAAAAHGETELRMLRACYACKVRFKVLHHFYAQLCPECAALNFAKRNQTASLSGRVFLVTGARVKIGFHVVLKLLRCGATVLATSRFPADTAARYAAQPDASSWIDRLRIYGLDMRDLSSLELFCRHLIGTCHRLDGIVNNACQTIRRPAAYYAHLMPLELQPGTWNPEAPLWSAEPGVPQPDEGTASQFPLGVVDVNGQQLDTRTTNSWLLKLHEVSTPEVAEVLAINALAPFILNSRLRGLLEATPDRPAFVVNVSAMEGKFYRYKTPNHPHTNMAKAALNMMTRTCAEELASCGVLMNSVDTGWINDENPLEKAAATAAHNHFQTPLDEIDAAARILDPILSVVNGGEHVHGKFLKDYRPIEW